MHETKEENQTPRLTELEREVLLWRTGDQSDLHRSVYKCLVRAEGLNLQNFKTLFPLQVLAYKAWHTTPGFADALRAKIQWIPYLKHLSI